jgi:DNA-binding transcriptional regulator YdaS (Cro superfamily)
MHELYLWFAEERGRQSMLADLLMITPSAISQWRQIPIGHVTPIFEITGIPRWKLRPDIFEDMEAKDDG